MTQNVENSRTYGYRDSISNGRNYAIKGKCEASTSKTFTWSVGSTLGAEIKAGIFGGVKTEINSSVAKSTTTGYVTSAEFKVPKKDTVYCDRGTVNETIKGFTRLSYCHRWVREHPGADPPTRGAPGRLQRASPGIGAATAATR